MPRVECPKCERVLSMPPKAGIRKIRCQACSEVFVYTPPQRDFDDQVVDWLSEDHKPADDEEDAQSVVARIQESITGSARTAVAGKPTA